MNSRIIPIAPAQPSTRQRKREAPKGRVVDPTALDEVRAVLGDRSRARDLLIEHLHLLQDHFDCEVALQRILSKSHCNTRSSKHMRPA